VYPKDTLLSALQVSLVLGGLGQGVPSEPLVHLPRGTQRTLFQLHLSFAIVHGEEQIYILFKI
jgi:hypothetical protein